MYQYTAQADRQTAKEIGCGCDGSNRGPSLASVTIVIGISGGGGGRHHHFFSCSGDGDLHRLNQG
ncbi:hypothetical protein TYRP_001746 [Tyrophagus putrescentiae]|nr:hypothetical protein TYRP_001746 [Tyrophagus putrescentiae]